MLFIIFLLPFTFLNFTFLTIKAAIDKDKNFNIYAIIASLIFAIIIFGIGMLTPKTF